MLRALCKIHVLHAPLVTIIHLEQDTAASNGTPSSAGTRKSTAYRALHHLKLKAHSSPAKASSSLSKSRKITVFASAEACIGFPRHRRYLAPSLRQPKRPATDVRRQSQTQLRVCASTHLCRLLVLLVNDCTSVKSTLIQAISDWFERQSVSVKHTDSTGTLTRFSWRICYRNRYQLRNSREEDKILTVSNFD